jgi:hypothetical protein
MSGVARSGRTLWISIGRAATASRSWDGDGSPRVRSRTRWPSDTDGPGHAETCRRPAARTRHPAAVPRGWHHVPGGAPSARHRTVDPRAPWGVSHGSRPRGWWWQATSALLSVGSGAAWAFGTAQFAHGLMRTAPTTVELVVDAAIHVRAGLGIRVIGAGTPTNALTNSTGRGAPGSRRRFSISPSGEVPTRSWLSSDVHFFEGRQPRRRCGRSWRTELGTAGGGFSPMCWPMSQTVRRAPWRCGSSRTWSARTVFRAADVRLRVSGADSGCTTSPTTSSGSSSGWTAGWDTSVRDGYLTAGETDAAPDRVGSPCAPSGSTWLGPPARLPRDLMPHPCVGRHSGVMTTLPRARPSPT